MKTRKTVILLVAAFVLALWAGAAQAAGLTNTAHDISGAQGGACGACHIPHASGGSRLWVDNPVSGTAPGSYAGSVAPLCGYCHYPNMGGGITLAQSQYYVYGTNSHGRMMTGSTANLPYGHVASGLPYMNDAADANIECTTCHNVHSNDAPPFMRRGINEICSMCHGFRKQQSGAGWAADHGVNSTDTAAWGGTWTGDGNPGSHPVGTDITGNVYQGPSPISIPAIMSVAVTTGRDAWTLGGHLTGGDSGGVICVTCHAVHGIQYDGQFAGSGLTVGSLVTPNFNFLAVDQGSGQTYNGRTVSNGHGYYNELCETCHAGSELAYDGDATVNPNPGNTSATHPVDDIRVEGSRNWVTGFPTNWPSGNYGAASTSQPNVICESCHVTHAYADSTRGDDSLNTFGLSDFILRDSRPAICADCHSSTGGQKHHPVGLTFDQPASGAATYLANVTSGALNTLECSTCHAASGAHNWTVQGAVGLDASWYPTDNARTATYNANMSRTCMDCHYNFQASPRFSPTLNNGVSTFQGPGSEGYQLHGDASHYIGGLDPRNAYANTLADYWTNLTTGLGARLNPQTTAWGSAYGGSGGYSRFAGTSASPTLVCESCHELEAGKNANTHLLLATYTEQANGSAYARTNDPLCVGCHDPKGTHQMTGDMVSTNRPSGPTALSTNTAVAWLATPSSGPSLSSNANFTCDSCHQPHDAPNASLTYILDVANTALDNTGQTTGTSNGGLPAGYATPYDDETTQVNYQSFCNKCHPYE